MNHQDRLKLAERMIKQQKTDDEIVDAFRVNKDFNEIVVRKHIKRIRKLIA